MAIQQESPSRHRAGSRRPGWRRRSPVLTDGSVTLRALQQSDAPALLANLSRPAVQRYSAPCPPSLAGMQRFVRWTHAERRRGLHVCYGIVPAGATRPVGIVQIWAIDRNFSTAEWGFALCDDYWGTGLFARAARLMLDFAFATLGVRRLEARAVDGDDRGNASLRKLGATREGVLRQGFCVGGARKNYVMWSILADEWRAARAACPGTH